MTQFLVYDVFTDQPFGGNQLAVLPDATGLAEDSLQKIAREFNFSETTFVFPPRNSGTDAHVRIFTPGREVDFAGHPTIGTAVALYALGQIGAIAVLELGVGPIQVAITGNTARFVTRTPLTTAPGPDSTALAAALSLDISDIRTDRHAPVTAGLGLDFVLVELKTGEALARSVPDIDAFRAMGRAHLGFFCYTRDTSRIEARMFAPLEGIFEDPATGSAAAALAAYLGEKESCSQSFEITQGVTMGRPSQITANVTVKDGKASEVAISGQAIKTMEGQLTL